MKRNVGIPCKRQGYPEIGKENHLRLSWELSVPDLNLLLDHHQRNSGCLRASFYATIADTAKHDVIVEAIQFEPPRFGGGRKSDVASDKYRVGR